MFVRLLSALVCIIMLGANCAYSWNVRCFSKDDDIISALKLLKSIGAEEVFENLEENSVKIIFYDLSLINYNYRNHFAINSIDNWGERYILINSKYRSSSTEELACLIAHESFHKAEVSTLQEETLATKKEAFYWSILKMPNKEYQTVLSNRLNNLVCLYNDSTISYDLIENRIRNSRFYQTHLAVRDKGKF